LKNQQAIELFRTFLKKGQNRITPERFEVLNAAIEYHGHFGADDLLLMKNRNQGYQELQFIKLSNYLRSAIWL
jgi:Fe2+ or Zn2+ uptake regulation protein